MQQWSDDEAEEPSVAAYNAACLASGVVACSRWRRSCAARHAEISLAHYGVGKRGAAPLAASLRLAGQLVALDLSDNGLGAEGVEAVLRGLGDGGGPSLATLDLSQNQAGPDGAAALGELLSDARAAPALRRLRFNTNAIGDKGAAAVAAGLADDGRLVELALEYNEIASEGVGAARGAAKSGWTLAAGS